MLGAAYTFASTQAPGLTTAAPLAGGGGVFGVDLTLTSLQAFLDASALSIARRHDPYTSAGAAERDGAGRSERSAAGARGRRGGCHWPAARNAGSDGSRRAARAAGSGA